MDRWNRRAQGDLYTAEQIKRVLTGAGIEVESDLDLNYIIFCPFHNNSRTPAGEVHKENGLFFCFSCQKTAPLIEVVMHSSGRSYFEAARFIKSKEGETNLEAEVQKQLYAKPEFLPFDEVVLKRLYNGLLISDRAKNYFKYRKINTESWSKFSLGYSIKQDMVTVPVHSPDGMPVGLVGRSIEGKRFKNSTNLPRSKTMFNLNRAKREGGIIIVVESSFDVIKLFEAGFPNAVATLGGHLSNENLDNLNRYSSKIIIATDADEAGRKLGETIATKLKNKEVLWASYEYGMIYPHGAKDIGDMTNDEAKQCILNAVPHFEYMTWK
jgi:DNA primase